MSDENLLSTADLHVAFSLPGGREARAVDGVNLEVKPGEIVALAGESGCGKTTLARTLLGLEKPTAGAVTFGGKPLGTTTKQLRAFRKKVQLVLQDPTGALNPRQTVYEAVAEGLRIHGIHDDEHGRVVRALSQAGLRPAERYLMRYSFELSGGQRQRVVIAGALALAPKIIVADEPVASLDASVRGEILALLKELRDDYGLGALVVTHDLGLAWNIADRIAVMYLGRIVEQGPVEQVLLDPQHPYTRALVSVLPESPVGEPQVLTGEAPDASAIPSGCRFHSRCPVYNSGVAEQVGVAEKCTTVDLNVLGSETRQWQAACHVAHVSGREEVRDTVQASN
ncbi:ABC transporter ATP-binding protein [Bogoriella caseilytica]|uniref:Peptide/nickel transport system ATP-binding protein n=1 Tax=Bogoriella caseilytica TaxID=56055 RepID=A0A3N2BD82_9MICO|nr:ABC transporter ATP-binding protein [Bogoriella caseilytica]ROR73213.1 peptide/nickel transport system ATP-binding protein [Bogoriella caseilytica]